MRFSSYLTETVWAGLDKTLPLIYGFGYVFFAARALSEHEFGLLALIQVAFYFILMIDNSMVYLPMAKFAAEENHQGWAIATGFLLSFGVAVISSAVCFFGKGAIASLLNAPELKTTIWYVPLLLAGFYLKDLTAQICIARQRIARLFVIDAVYFLGSLVILFFWHSTGRLSLATHVISANILTAFAASAVGLVFTQEFLRKAHWRIRRIDLLRFFAFSKYSFGTGLGAYLNGQLDLILISYFYGPVQVGIYNAGKIIYRLYNLFSQAAQVIIFPLASKLHAARQHADLRALFEKAVYFSYLGLIPLNVALLLGTDWIFSEFYAGKYSEAIPVFRWLVIGAFVLPWGQIGANILLGAGKPEFNFRIIWTGVFVQTALGLLLIPQFSITGAAVTIVITVFCGALLVIYHVRLLTGFTLQGILSRHADVSNFRRALWQKSVLEQAKQKERADEA